MKALFFAAVMLLIGGCAAPTPGANNVAAGDDCRREIPTGSSIAVTRCRTKADLDRDAANARDTRDAIDRNNSIPRGPGENTRTGR